MDLRIDIKGHRKDVPVYIIYTVNQYIACTGDMKFLLKVPVSLKKKRLKMSLAVKSSMDKFNI
jgi:cellobiose phosphorylase